MKNILKGFIIGIGKIIPGVSGSMLAILMGVYEHTLQIIAKLPYLKWSDITFIIYLSLGVFGGISLFSQSVNWLLKSFYLTTMLLFIGLIASGIPDIIKKCKFQEMNFSVKLKSTITILGTFIFSYLLTKLGSEHLSSNNTYLNITWSSLSINQLAEYFILGLLEAFSSIVPGISGTAIFMSLDCYELILSFYSNLLNINYWSFGLIFILGIITGIIILAKIITYLINRHKQITYAGILGFITASLLIMLLKILPNINAFQNNFGQNIWFILKMIAITYIGYYLGRQINKILAND